MMICKLLRSSDENLVEVFGEKKAETEKSICIYDGSSDIWIPKSQIEELEQGEKNQITFCIPEWLAIEKGVI